MVSSYLSQLTARTVWSPPDALRDRPILGAFLGKSAAFMVETGASPAHAEQFRGELLALGAPAPRYAGVTHWHWDHVFGTDALDLPTFAHDETRRRVLEMARLDWRDAALDARVKAGQELVFIADHVKIELTNAERGALVIHAPDISFSEGVEVNLDGLTVQLLHVGGDHSPDSSVIFCAEEQVAFVGDCFYNGFHEQGCFYTTRQLFPLLDTLERLPVAHYVRSHDPAPLTRAQFLHDAQVLRRTGELVERLQTREAVLAQLPGLLGEPLNEMNIEDVDCFLLGLRLDA